MKLKMKELALLPIKALWQTRNGKLTILAVVALGCLAVFGPISIGAPVWLCILLPLVYLLTVGITYAIMVVVGAMIYAVHKANS